MRDPTELLVQGLAERYRVERLLGEGGMALVYEAHDLRHDREVAIKVLRPEVGAAIGSERFLQEIRICAKLFHPHILTLLDSGETNGLLYYVMPLVTGESLRDRIRSEKILPIAAALRIARECAGALAFAHGRGVVHRDIKPENVLFEADHAIVADFGIARALGASGGERLTTLGLVLGTPSYMSPEQAAGESDVGDRSDIYSLAAVVFEMLTGRPPFEGKNAGAVMAKQVTQPAPSVSSLRAEVPANVNVAIARALAKKPADRYATAAEFAAALDAPAAEPVRTRANPLRLAGFAALVLAAIVGGYAWLSHENTKREESLGAVASGFNQKLEQITVSEGVEQWPTWSPDGKSLAYSSDMAGSRKIVVRTIATGEERQLTHGAYDDIQPSWSGDGNTIAFVRARAAATRLEPADVNGVFQENGDVWTVDVRTAKERRLIENAFDPAYSGDGKKLAFHANWAGGAQRIWVADAEGRNARQLTTDSSEAVVHSEPAWSHDGNRLSFRRTEKTNSDIAIVDVSSGRLSSVTHDNVLDMNAVWGVDDRAIYYSSAGGGGGINLWRINLNQRGERDGPAQQLTTGAGDDINPAVSPGGQQVAFSLRAFDSDIWKLPVDPLTGRATGPPQPVSATTRVESRAAWSPDGKVIAFNSDRRQEMNIWLKVLETGEERQLTTGPGGDYQPNWSPDGKSLAFFSARAGNSDIWTIDIASRRLARLTTSGAMDTNPFYSPDGKQIAFMSDRRGRLEVWVMNANGSSQRPISDLGAGGHFIRWTPDGKFVVFRAEAGMQFQTIQVRVTDGSAQRLRDVSSGAHISWSPRHDVMMDVKGHKTLFAYGVSGEPVKVFEFADTQVRIDYPVWSPDGKWIIFDRAAPRGGDIWMLRAQ